MTERIKDYYHQGRQLMMGRYKANRKKGTIEILKVMTKRNIPVTVFQERMVVVNNIFYHYSR